MEYCALRNKAVGGSASALYAVIPLGCVWVLLFLVWSSFFLLLSLASPFGCFILFVAAVVADAALRSLFLYGPPDFPGLDPRFLSCVRFF